MQASDPGRGLFWSDTTIPGKPRLLMVDASGNAQGWEREFCERIVNVLRRKDVELAGGGAMRVDRAQDLAQALQDQESFNCMLLLCHGTGASVPQESNLSAFWAWMSGYDALSPKLLAVCTCEDNDPETSQRILGSSDSFAQLAVVPQSPLSPRAAGLFFMKFFTELDLHAHDSITGKMVWFSHSKAREILKRRHLPGQVGVRC